MSNESREAFEDLLNLAFTCSARQSENYKFVHFDCWGLKNFADAIRKQALEEASKRSEICYVEDLNGYQIAEEIRRLK